MNRLFEKYIADPTYMSDYEFTIRCFVGIVLFKLVALWGVYHHLLPWG